VEDLGEAGLVDLAVGFGGGDPAAFAEVGFEPVFEEVFDQEGEDLDAAAEARAGGPAAFFGVLERAEGFLDDLAANAGFFEGLVGGGLGW